MSAQYVPIPFLVREPRVIPQRILALRESAALLEHRNKFTRPEARLMFFKVTTLACPATPIFSTIVGGWLCRSSGDFLVGVSKKRSFRRKGSPSALCLQIVCRMSGVSLSVDDFHSLFIPFSLWLRYNAMIHDVTITPFCHFYMVISLLFGMATGNGQRADLPRKEFGQC
ncbi:hypothetical protein ACFQUU_08255 [Herbaspirillum sp. GCM10030257]|uniref:hypothetical protein n=1 Tax=Herbaspirillum sp. GCM10030257 TaxID=3273393 RepID=UPI00361523EC